MTPAGPRRGEVWLVDLPEGRGSEQQGRRPAVIVQNDAGNRFSPTTIVAIVTTNPRVFPVTVPLEPEEGGLRKKSSVNLAQIQTISHARLRRRLGALTRERMAQIGAAIRISLDADLPADN